MQANPDDFRFGRSYLPAQAYEKRKEYIRKRTMLRRFSDSRSRRFRNRSAPKQRSVPHDAPRKTERTGAEKRPESRSGSDVPPGSRLPNSQTHHAMSDRKHILIVSNACYPELSPRAFRTTGAVTG